MHIVTDNVNEAPTLTEKDKRNIKIKRYAFVALVAASAAIHVYDHMQKKNEND